MSFPLYARVARFLDAFVVSHALPAVARGYGAGLLAPLVWRWQLRFHGAARLTHTPGEAVQRELVHRGIGQAVVWGRGVDTHQFEPERRDEGWRRWL